MYFSFSQLRVNLSQMENPNENPILKRHEIYERLKEQIPEIKRRSATPRVMAVTDALLDQMLELDELDINKIGEISDELLESGGRWDSEGRY